MFPQVSVYMHRKDEASSTDNKGGGARSREIRVRHGSDV